MNSNSNHKNAIFLTLVFPFAGLIYTLSHWRERWAKNTFWLACIYMGAVLVYWPDGTSLGEASDGGRYVLQLMKMYGSDISIHQIFSMFLTDEFHMDLYQSLMTFFVSRFTNNGHVLFAAFAFVFGFFYSRNIWYILEKFPFDRNLGSITILVALFFLACPITSINGVRMWTALHVFVYGMMPYLLERNKTKFWWVLITPLIHFSFLYVAGFALVYFILPYRLKTNNQFFLLVAFVFFIVTLFINTLNLNSVQEVLEEYTPDSFDRKIEVYTRDVYVERVTQSIKQSNWYIIASANLKKWVYNLLLIFLLPCLKRNYIEKNNLFHLYVFTLLLSGFANIMSMIPSGGRFQLLTQMFKIPLILLVVLWIPKKDNFSQLVNIALLFLLIPLVVDIRKLFDFFSITVLLGNFITVFFWESNVLLINFIKHLL